MLGLLAIIYSHIKRSVCFSCCEFDRKSSVPRILHLPFCSFFNNSRQVLDVPAHALIDRIAKLQSDCAKQTERIEFLEEHTAHLVKELQKKSKLLQNYIMREQTGALSSKTMDRNKVNFRCRFFAFYSVKYPGRSRAGARHNLKKIGFSTKTSLKSKIIGR